MAVMKKQIIIRWGGGVVALAVLALTSACSSQQVYGASQAWRRNQCYQLTQLEDRQRCLKDADQPYDSYQKNADSLSTGNKPATEDRQP
jgi:hypothetical protein